MCFGYLTKCTAALLHALTSILHFLNNSPHHFHQSIIVSINVAVSENSVEESTEPCGAPARIGRDEESVLSTQYWKVRFDKWSGMMLVIRIGIVYKLDRYARLCRTP
ncbi:unnamed protein product [Euphydryas editha]|uniref:Uncharacterized protein n=1 Tax=Euphydryas editha TaxID=104508 RepID=A0AAU9UVQ6_EUPED|nr:unnamed protein product [Euphydryas editha]